MLLSEIYKISNISNMAVLEQSSTFVYFTSDYT